MRVILLLLFLIPGLAQATVWKIVPKDSSVTFTATQNDAPVTGSFKTFTGEINFDPARLNTSNVHIVVDIASVSTTYADVAITLKTSDWFDVKVFPQAIFQAKDFTKAGDKTYQAHGTLTIRDKTIPTMLTFTLEEYSSTHARAKGSATLKRTAFGVGRGDWAKTDEIKDDVLVNFILVASN